LQKKWCQIDAKVEFHIVKKQMCSVGHNDFSITKQ